MFPSFFGVAFCPYHIGHFTIMGLKLKGRVGGTHFEGMLTTLTGTLGTGTLEFIYRLSIMIRGRIFR